jgi:hypothetical protein
MKIEELTFFGDAELIVHQVRNIYQKDHPRLKYYRTEVSELIDNLFSTFNIFFVPREANTLVDSSVVSASNFKITLPPKPKYNDEFKYRPTIPGNFMYWKDFEDDQEINMFLETTDEFSSLHIDQDLDDDKNLHADKFLNKIADHKILQFPSNHILKGLVPLESLFEKNDVFV